MVIASPLSTAIPGGLAGPVPGRRDEARARQSQARQAPRAAARSAPATAPAPESPRERRGHAGGRPKGLWLYGRHAVEAALANPSRSCHRLLATAEALAALGAAARRPGLEVLTVEREELDRRLGPGAVHQGLALSAAPLPRLELERACAPEPGRNLVLLLDQVTDPHNSARSCARRRRSRPAPWSCRRAAAPSSAARPPRRRPALWMWCRWSRSPTSRARSTSWPSSATGGSRSTATPRRPRRGARRRNLVLVLGAEGSGLRRLVRERCDFAARLPIAPAMESLNVSVACGIALYALARSATSRT